MDEILERLPAGFLIFRDDGIVTVANKTLHDLLGYQCCGLEGQAIESLFSLPSRIFYQTHLFPLLKIQEKVDEIYLVLRHKNSEGVPVLLNARTVVTDGSIHHECLVIPMQNRDRYEEEILHSREIAQAVRVSLEDLVKERTSELEHLVRELNGLTYSIAHNLRAPLRAIHSTSSLIQSEVAKRLTKEQLGLLDRQKHNVETLSSLIDDLLKLSRLGGRLPVKKEVNVSDLAQKAATEAVVGRESEFDITICTGVKAWADPGMIELVCESLMSNAVKYSPQGGAITFGGQQKDGEMICFVKDEGIGMETRYLQRIFEPFERLHRDEFSGNGVGLAIVDRIIRHHKGRVWAESGPMTGAIIFFTLPLLGGPTRSPKTLQ